MTVKPPILFFGSAVFGSANVPHLQDPATASNFLDEVRSLGISEIDTAARYPHDNIGGSERMLGTVSAASKGFNINTKILFSGASTDGSLSKAAINKSVDNSLKALGTKKVRVLYAHLVDNVTPLEEQAAALNEQFQNGLCEEIGVCNFPVEILEALIDICEKKGYRKPTVYQGQYNLICRSPESGVIQLLRKHNMTFVAYSPLGGGFLTGKLTSGNAQGTRFDSAYGKHFKAWYDKPEFHEAIRGLHEVIDPLDIAPTEAALRWLSFHSLLGSKDGIILGATKIPQIQKNVADIGKGPLPQAVVDKIEAINVMIGATNTSFTVEAAKLPQS